MLTNKAGESAGLDINKLQYTAMNVVENYCSVISRPVELIIRPFHGTRYFPVPVIFFSTAMMIALPILSVLTTTAVSMIPFTHFTPPMGLFGIGSLAKLYFLLSFAHGIRIYRRMIHMELEECSEFEGPPLPFFRLLPKSDSFWFTRIVLEPAFVLVTAMVLEHIYIIQSGLATYLEFAAFCLAMKSFIDWYKAWEFLRILIDMRFAGPIIARLAENRATDEDLASIHIASFPKNLAPDIREAAVSHIARAYSLGDKPAL
jgi:hypothetical protein